MIVIFPMLISQAVSENAVPAIAKTAELYLVGNKVHEIINSKEVKKHTKAKNQSYKIVGKKIIARESVNLMEDFEEDMKKDGSGTKEKASKDFEDRMERQRQKEKEEEEREIIRAKEEREKAKEKREKDKAERDEEREKAKEEREEEREKEKEKREKAKGELEKEKQKASKASVNIKMTDYKTISLEPTFLPVEYVDEHGNVSKSMIGVKVLPLRVKSDARLSALIITDTQMNKISSILVGGGRTVLRSIYKYIGKWFSRFGLGGGTVSGDPRKDILMGKSGQKGTGFIVLNKDEDIDDLFLKNYSKINRLFKMGWGNIIIADEINRTAYFCMKEYKGVCNALSYSMMYQNLGQLKVYETLEDAKRQSSSLFKIKKRFTKIIGESIAEQKLVKYSSINEDE